MEASFLGEAKQPPKGLGRGPFTRTLGEAANQGQEGGGKTGHFSQT